MKYHAISMNWGIKEYFFLEISESRELKHLLQRIIAGGAARIE